MFESNDTDFNFSADQLLKYYEYYPAKIKDTEPVIFNEDDVDFKTYFPEEYKWISKKNKRFAIDSSMLLSVLNMPFVAKHNMDMSLDKEKAGLDVKDWHITINSIAVEPILYITDSMLDNKYSPLYCVSYNNVNSKQFFTRNFKNAFFKLLELYDYAASGNMQIRRKI